MGLPQRHEEVPHICGYLSNGLKRLNYQAPNKGKEAEELPYKKGLLALILCRKVRANRLKVRISYYSDKEEDMGKKENCNITPFIHLSPRLNTYHSLSCHPQGC